MKKLLLSMAALGLAAGAWAETLDPAVYTDYTPEYYKFYKGNENFKDIFRPELSNPASNLGSGGNYWLTDNTGEGKLFTAENQKRGNILMGAWLLNNNRREDFANAASMYNFGGKLGSVMVWNGKGSKFNETVAEKLGVDNPNLPEFGWEVPQNFTFFWVLDNISMKAGMTEGARAHVRIEFNAFNNAMDESVVFSELRYQNDGGNAFGAQQNITYSQFAEDGEWNPYRFMVYEFEVPYNTNNDGKEMSGYLRMVNGTGGFKSAGTILFRSVEIYGVEEEQLANNEVKISWNDYTPGAYSDIKAITLSHAQDHASYMNLSAGEEAELTINVETVDGGEFDPETVFTVNLECEHLAIDSEVVSGNTVKLRVHDDTLTEGSLLTVSAGDVVSNEIAINHFAAYDNMVVSLNDAVVTENNMTFYAKDENVLDTEHSVNVDLNSASENKPFECFNVAVVEGNCAEVGEGVVYGKTFTITPRSIGNMTLAITPVKAGEYESNAAEYATAPELYTVSVDDAAGIATLTVSDSNGTVLYNLQGVRVSEPAAGMYIRRNGDKAEKVIVK